MKLRELLTKLKEVQDKIGASEPYICGGTPRDRYMGHLENISDLDITTGDKSVDYLSQEFAITLRKNYNVTRKSMDDGHSTIFVGNLKMDFSSNFNVPSIDTILKNINIPQPTDMQKEMFSRDFTCNSLLLSLDLRELTDPTNRGFQDIKDKVIRTCLAPEITLTSNRNRVARAIYLATKLDFDVDPYIIKYVAKHPDTVKISTDKSLNEKLHEAFTRDPDKASYLITRMNIWNHIPISKIMQPYYMKHVKGKSMFPNKKAYFQGGGGVNDPTPKNKKYKSDPAIVVQPRFKEPFYRNYDPYETEGKHTPGAGSHHMNDFKSVKEFLEHKRKRMKDKYKADDYWQLDNGERTKKNPHIQTRAVLLNRLVKTAYSDVNKIDFSIDEQIDSTILGDSGIYSDSVPIGGQLDEYLTLPDFEGKSPDKLDFGRDYAYEEKKEEINDIDIVSLIEKYLKSGEPHLYGLPDGINSPEDLDAPSNENPQYGKTDSGNTLYNKM